MNVCGRSLVVICTCFTLRQVYGKIPDAMCLLNLNLTKNFRSHWFPMPQPHEIFYYDKYKQPLILD